ncbi:MAG: SCP2 sterol-binding domain-containing protein [Chromatiales bacterium]|nr:SCP2 sterol-binding domain-containing protein [Chromatiales bacterium]
MAVNDLASLLLSPAQALVNRGIAGSATAQGLARDLEGQALELAISGTPLRIMARVGAGQLELLPSDGGDADVRLAGAPLALLALLGPDPQQPVRDGRVRLTGDTAVADRFRALLRAARPDLEEQLARLAGDPLAHGAGNLARGGAAWARNALGSFERSLGEYLREERRWLPTRPEVGQWLVEVDRLRDDVERAGARLERLRRSGHDGQDD